LAGEIWLEIRSKKRVLPPLELAAGLTADFARVIFYVSCAKRLLKFGLRWHNGSWLSPQAHAKLRNFCEAIMKQRRIKAVVKVTARKINARRAKPQSDPAEGASYKAVLEQAEVCREQAHDAVRLKRWKAACGLLSTAVALCNRAVTMSGDACSDACAEARDALRQMQMEMATYGELARSMEKPLLSAPMPVSLMSEKTIEPAETRLG
jgi:hypothetical protein